MTVRSWVLAVAAVGLAACRGGSATPALAAGDALPDSAEQVMFGLKHQLTAAGVRRAQLTADTAYFYDDGNRIEMKKVRIVFFTSAGDSNGVLTGRTGTYDVRQQRVTGRGDVRVTTVDGRRLTSPQLTFDRVINQITSDTSFVFNEPGRTLSGIGLRTDPQLRNVQVMRGFRGRTDVDAAALDRPSTRTTAPTTLPQPTSAPPIALPVPVPVPAPASPPPPHR